jgi:hypothetical protein
MNYKDKQKKKAINLRDEVFKDPGDGQFNKISYPFVLKEPYLNLWAGVREDILNYFKRNNIPFWDSGTEPTGHLLSSQIACLNHLYFLRQRGDIATAVLKGIDKNIKAALILDNGQDSGYVDFEVIGAKNYLGEKLHTRGANSTSVDALMLAELNNGNRKLIFIEWKYVETYSKISKADGDSGKTRLGIYQPLLSKSDSPINVTNIEGLFTEPYYQLMRQTLLAHEMSKAMEYKANSYLHLHIIPKDNIELKNVNTAKGKLDGDVLEQTWKNVLKLPDLYQAVDPHDFLKPAFACTDCTAPLTYLKRRYWDEQ